MPCGAQRVSAYFYMREDSVSARQGRRGSKSGKREKPWLAMVRPTGSTSAEDEGRAEKATADPAKQEVAISLERRGWRHLVRRRGVNRDEGR